MGQNAKQTRETGRKLKSITQALGDDSNITDCDEHIVLGVGGVDVSGSRKTKTYASRSRVALETDRPRSQTSRTTDDSESSKDARRKLRSTVRVVRDGETRSITFRRRDSSGSSEKKTSRPDNKCEDGDLRGVRRDKRTNERNKSKKCDMSARYDQKRDTDSDTSCGRNDYSGQDVVRTRVRSGGRKKRDDSTDDNESQREKNDKRGKSRKTSPKKRDVSVEHDRVRRERISDRVRSGRPSRENISDNEVARVKPRQKSNERNDKKRDDKNRYRDKTSEKSKSSRINGSNRKLPTRNRR